jgi:hypothetical protein
MVKMHYGFFAASALTLVVPTTSVGEHDAIVPASQQASPADAVKPHRQVAAYGNMPIRFEPNVGQTSPQIQYSARGNGYSVAITGQGAVLSLRRTAHGVTFSAPREAAQVRLYPMHASAQPRLLGERQLDSVSNYFIGDDPAKWRKNVANYAAVRYEQIYPGIDWVLYGRSQQLEYDFVVAPHADPPISRTWRRFRRDPPRFLSPRSPRASRQIRQACTAAAANWDGVQSAS